MKVLLENLGTAIAESLRQIKAGVLAAREEGVMLAELPDEVQFQIEVVTGLNGIERRTTGSQEGDTISETVELGHVVTRSEGIRVTRQIESGYRQVDVTNTEDNIPQEVTTDHSTGSAGQQGVNGTSGSDTVTTKIEYE